MNSIAHRRLSLTHVVINNTEKKFKKIIILFYEIV